MSKQSVRKDVEVIRAKDESKPSETKEIALAENQHNDQQRPIPRMGWPAFSYRFAKLFMKEPRVPKLSRKEREMFSTAYDEALVEDQHRTEQLRQDRVHSESVSQLRQLTNVTPNLTLAFWNTKGAGGVTTTTVNATAVLADESRTLTAVIDGNPAAGTVAARYGLDYDDTITIQTLARDINSSEDLRHRDFRSVIKQARPSINGVRVISADSIIEEHRRLSGEGMTNVLDLISYNCEYLSIDTGNDIGDTSARAIAEKSDVFVFTANVAVPDSLRKLSTSMETLRRLGFSEKVDRSVVVISNLQPEHNLDDFRLFLNEVTYEDKVKRPLEQHFHGQFLGVPYDSYIALDRVVKLDQLGWETYQAYIELVIAILEQGALADEGTTSAINGRSTQSSSNTVQSDTRSIVTQ